MIGFPDGIVDSMGRTLGNLAALMAALSCSVSVKAYGAAGDGVQDDTPHVQAAINAVKNSVFGGTVCFPAGAYKLTDALNLTPAVDGTPLTLCGTPFGGSQLRFDAFLDDAAVSTKPSNLIVRGLDFRASTTDGNVSRYLSLSGANTLGPILVENCHFQSCNGTPGTSCNAAVWLSNVNNTTVRNCTFAHNGILPLDQTAQSCEIVANASSGTANSGIRIEGNRIIGHATTLPILLNDCSSSWITDNYIDQGDHGNEPSLGMAITMFPILQPARMQRNHIERNTIVNSWGMGIYVSFWDDGVIANNILNDVQKTQDDPSFSSGAIGIRGVGNVVSGNRIDTCGKSGISWNGANVVTGNHIKSAGACGLRTFAVIVASGSVIDSNRVESCAQSGIRCDSSTLAGANTGIRIIGNTVNTSGGTGIEFLGDADECTVSGNEVTGCTSQAIVMTVGARYVVTDNTVHANADKGIDCRAPNSVISNNRLRNNATQGVYCTQPNCVVSDNIVTGCDPGIHLPNTNTNSIVEGNQCIGNGVNGGGNGGLLLGAGSQHTVVNNQVYGNTGGNIIDGATDTLRTGNRVTAAGIMSGSKLLAGATTTVATTEVLTGDEGRIQLQRTAAGTGGATNLTINNIVPGTSFDIVSSVGAGENGTVSWRIDH